MQVAFGATLRSSVLLKWTKCIKPPLSLSIHQRISVLADLLPVSSFRGGKPPNSIIAHSSHLNASYQYGPYMEPYVLFV